MVSTTKAGGKANVLTFQIAKTGAFKSYRAAADPFWSAASARCNAIPP